MTFLSTLFEQLSVIELRLLETLAIILILGLLRWLLLLALRRHTQDARTHYQWRKGLTYTFFVIGLLAVGRVWFVGFRSIATFLGLAAAGLVIALREPLLNMTAWIFLVSRRHFVIGDRIEIGDRIGDVIDQRLFEFSLLEVGNWVGSDQSTGRVIHVPNARVFEEPIANYTRGFPYIWDELEVVISFESNWHDARDILLRIVQQRTHSISAAEEARILAESRSSLIFYSTLAPTVYTAVVERGVSLAARYICDPRQRRDTAQAIWEQVLDEFRAHADIDFAYPTQRFFDRAVERRTLAPDTRSDAT